MLVRLVTESHQGLDAAFVLEEIVGGLGVVLWQLLRDVVLWSAASEAERSRLFHESSAALERLLSRVAVPDEISGAVKLALARTTLGQLYAGHRDLPRARSAFLQAIRATRGKRDALEVRAQAGIGLFHNANARKAPREAERAARVVLRAFGTRYPEITIVGRQLAEQLLRQGKNTHALHLLKRLRHFRVPRAERVEILTLLARAGDNDLITRKD